MTTMSERTRTITWEDPRPAARAAREMSGLARLRAMAAGELPGAPFGAVIGMRLLEVREGEVVFALTPGEEHYNPMGTVHGGVAATMLDSAMGCAVLSALPAGSGFTTLELSVNFVRAITADTGPLRCEGRVVHIGSRIATTDGRLVDNDGRLYAHGTSTCMVLRRSATEGEART